MVGEPFFMRFSPLRAWGLAVNANFTFAIRAYIAVVLFHPPIITFSQVLREIALQFLRIFLARIVGSGYWALVGGLRLIAELRILKSVGLYRGGFEMFSASRERQFHAKLTAQAGTALNLNFGSVGRAN